MLNLSHTPFARRSTILPAQRHLLPASVLSNTGWAWSRSVFL